MNFSAGGRFDGGKQRVLMLTVRQPVELGLIVVEKTLLGLVRAMHGKSRVIKKERSCRIIRQVVIDHVLHQPRHMIANVIPRCPQGRIS